MSWYVITSLCHACYVSEYIYLHIFRINFLLKRHLSRGQGISCLAHHLERTDNKPLSRLIRTHTYKQEGQWSIKTGYRDAPLTFCNLAKAFKHNTICDSNGTQTHNHLVNEHSIVLPNRPND